MATHLIPVVRPFLFPELVDSLQRFGMFLHQAALCSLQLLHLELKTFIADAELVSLLLCINQSGAVVMSVCVCVCVCVCKIKHNLITTCKSKFSSDKFYHVVANA